MKKRINKMKIICIFILVIIAVIAMAWLVRVIIVHNTSFVSQEFENVRYLEIQNHHTKAKLFLEGKEAEIVFKEIEKLKSNKVVRGKYNEGYFYEGDSDYLITIYYINDVQETVGSGRVISGERIVPKTGEPLRIQGKKSFSFNEFLASYFTNE